MKFLSLALRLRGVFPLARLVSPALRRMAESSFFTSAPKTFKVSLPKFPVFPALQPVQLLRERVEREIQRFHFKEGRELRLETELVSRIREMSERRFYGAGQIFHRDRAEYFRQFTGLKEKRSTLWEKIGTYASLPRPPAERAILLGAGLRAEKAPAYGQASWLKVSRLIQSQRETAQYVKESLWGVPGERRFLKESIEKDRSFRESLRESLREMRETAPPRPAQTLNRNVYIGTVHINGANIQDFESFRRELFSAVEEL